MPNDSYSQGPPLYHALSDPQNIRVLKVLDANSNADKKLTSRLKQISLEKDSGTYFALSYTWGAPYQGHDEEKYEGENNEICIAVVNEKGDMVTTTIGRNLYDALRQFHCNATELVSDGEVTIWADALCINQLDQIEKSKQVQMMGKIYTRAFSVVSWLGPHDDRVVAANRNCKTLAQLLKAAQAKLGHEPSALLTESESMFGIEGLDLTLPKEEVRTIFHGLSHVRYFTRVWIFQEVVLARKLSFVCGNTLVDFNDVYTAIAWICDKITVVGPNRALEDGNILQLQELDEPRAFVFLVSTTFHRNRGLMKQAAADVHSRRLKDLFGSDEALVNSWFYLTDLLFLTQSLDCTNEIDRIFAVAGLCNLDAESLGLDALIIPDYSQSVRSCVIDLAIQLLQRLPYLWAFSSLSSERKLDDLPSWAPQITSIDARQPSGGGVQWGYLQDLKDGLLAPRLYDAHPRRASCRVGLHFEDRKLSLYGHLIRSFGEQNSFKLGTYYACDANLYVAAIMLRKCVTLGTEYKTGQGTLEAVVHTVLGGVSSADSGLVLEEFLAWLVIVIDASQRDQSLSDNSSNFEARLQRKAQKRTRACLDQLRGGEGLPTIDDFEALINGRVEDLRTPISNLLANKGQALAFEKRLISWLGSKALVSTENGYLALVPERVQPTDELWVLCRGKVPVVLRPSTSPGVYQILGEAYVHGGMHGEVMTGSDVGYGEEITLI